MSILRRDAALHDLIDLAYHIALDDVDAAYRSLIAAEESFRDLERMPLMGSSREFKNSALHGIRMWRVKDFPRHLNLLSTDCRWRGDHSGIAQFPRHSGVFAEE